MWGLPHNMPSQAARGCTLVPPPCFFPHSRRAVGRKKNLKQSKLSVPEGHCQIKIIANFADNKMTGGTPDQRRNAWFWRRGPQGPLMTTRWPCSFTLTVFQPGEGAPASLSTYTIGKKWKKCRDLRTGPIEISEFWHANSFRRIMKKSFSQDLDWITP